MVRECEVMLKDGPALRCTEAMVHGFNVYKDIRLSGKLLSTLTEEIVDGSKSFACQRCMHQMLLLKNVTHCSLHIYTCVCMPINLFGHKFCV